MTASIPVRVLLLSDTHGVLDPRVAAMARDCDIAVHAGDIGGPGVLRELRPRQRVVAVRGNNDTPRQWVGRDASVLARLPVEASVDLPGGVLAVVHGHRAGPVAQRHDRLRRRYAAARAVVYGHSHRLAIDQAHLPWVLNPGAAGRARTFGGPSCLILEARGDHWHVEPLRFAGRAARTG